MTPHGAGGACPPREATPSPSPAPQDEVLTDAEKQAAARDIGLFDALQVGEGWTNEQAIEELAWFKRHWLATEIEHHRSSPSSAWILGVPEVAAGHCRKFLIAFRTSYMKPEHKTVVGEAWYLNRKELETEDEHLIAANPDSDGVPFSGWHFLKDHCSYDEYYEAIGSDTTILGYQPLPEPPK